MKRTFQARFVGVGIERPAWVDKHRTPGRVFTDVADQLAGRPTSVVCPDCGVALRSETRSPSSILYQHRQTARHRRLTSGAVDTYGTQEGPGPVPGTEMETDMNGTTQTRQHRGGRPAIAADRVARFYALLDSGMKITKAGREVGIGSATATKYARQRADADRANAERPIASVVVTGVPAAVVRRIDDRREVIEVATDIQEESRRRRLLEAIVQFGPFDSVQTIVDAVRRPDERWGSAEVTRLIYGLSKEGLVAVRSGHDGGHHTLTRIRALPEAYRRVGYPAAHVPTGGRAGDPTDVRNLPSHTNGGPIEHITVNPRLAAAAELAEPRPVEVTREIAPEPVSPPQDDERQVTMVVEPTPDVLTAPEPSQTVFPVLTDLLVRRVEVDKVRRAARLIEEAADLLTGADRDQLLNRATGLVVDHDLSTVEEEYLRFYDRVTAVLPSLRQQS